MVGFGFSLFPISSGLSAHFHYWIDRKTTWHPALTNKRKGHPKLIRQSHEISLPIWVRDFADIHLLRLLLCAPLRHPTQFRSSLGFVWMRCRPSPTRSQGPSSPPVVVGLSTYFSIEPFPIDRWPVSDETSSLGHSFCPPPRVASIPIGPAAPRGEQRTTTTLGPLPRRWLPKRGLALFKCQNLPVLHDFEQ